jgi:hypothetical protein
MPSLHQPFAIFKFYLPIIIILPHPNAQLISQPLHIKEMFCGLRNNNLHLNPLMCQQTLYNKRNLDARNTPRGRHKDMFLPILILVNFHLLGGAALDSRRQW